MLGESHIFYGSVFGLVSANWHAQTIVADAEESFGAWTYRWITPVPGSPLAEHATENWYQFLGVETGCDNFTGTLETPR